MTAVEEHTATPGAVEAAPSRIERRPLTRMESLGHALTPRAPGAQVAALAVLLVLWEIVGRATPPYIFAPPSAVAGALVDLAGSGDLARALGQSLAALLLGYSISVVAGTTIGIALGWWRLFGRALDPIVAGLYVVPVAALVPLVVAWAGIDLTARVLVVVLFSVLDVILAAQAGVRRVDPALIDVARTFGAGRLQLLRRIVLRRAFRSSSWATGSPPAGRSRAWCSRRCSSRPRASEASWCVEARPIGSTACSPSSSLSH